MKKISCVILGYGDRSSRYAEYAKQTPDELEVIGIIDINELKRRQGKEAFNLKDNQIYDSLEDFLKADVKCDVVINGTMDQLHYVTTMPLLEKGYNILLEKPITANPQEYVMCCDIRHFILRLRVSSIVAKSVKSWICN